MSKLHYEHNRTFPKYSKNNVCMNYENVKTNTIRLKRQKKSYCRTKQYRDNTIIVGRLSNLVWLLLPTAQTQQLEHLKRSVLRGHLSHRDTDDAYPNVLSSRMASERIANAQSQHYIQPVTRREWDLRYPITTVNQYKRISYLSCTIMYHMQTTHLQ